MTLPREVFLGDDGSYTYVAFDAQARTVVIDRQAAARGDRGYRAAQLTSESGVLAVNRLTVHDLRSIGLA